MDTQRSEVEYRTGMFTRHRGFLPSCHHRFLLYFLDRIFQISWIVIWEVLPTIILIAFPRETKFTSTWNVRTYVTLFEDRMFEDELKKKSNWIRVDAYPMIAVLRKGEFKHRHTQRAHNHVEAEAEIGVITKCQGWAAANPWQRQKGFYPRTFQNCERMVFCCFKLPSVWNLVTTHTGN